VTAWDPSQTSRSDVCATRGWSEKKRLEKLKYMHGNPVKRGLVTSPDLWPWSSFRFYYLEDSSVLPMDRFP
jgi:putative transposase